MATMGWHGHCSNPRAPLFARAPERALRQGAEDDEQDPPFPGCWHPLRRAPRVQRPPRNEPSIYESTKDSMKSAGENLEQQGRRARPKGRATGCSRARRGQASRGQGRSSDGQGWRRDQGSCQDHGQQSRQRHEGCREQQGERTGRRAHGRRGRKAAKDTKASAEAAKKKLKQEAADSREEDRGVCAACGATTRQRGEASG